MRSSAEAVEARIMEAAIPFIQKLCLGKWYNLEYQDRVSEACRIFLEDLRTMPLSTGSFLEEYRADLDEKMRRILRRLTAAITAAAALCLATVPAWADSSETAPAFTVEEQNYIVSHPVVKIGYVQDRIPVSFTDGNGEFAGISRYIFDRVASLCGLEFEYLPLPQGDVTYEYLLEGGYDLVSSVEYNKENQQARGILISDPYFSSRKVVVAREGLNFRFDAALTIAISTGSQTIRTVLGASYPNFELVDYPTITDCFDAVNSGKASM